MKPRYDPDSGNLEPSLTPFTNMSLRLFPNGPLEWRADSFPARGALWKSRRAIGERGFWRGCFSRAALRFGDPGQGLLRWVLRLTSSRKGASSLSPLDSSPGVLI